MGVKYSTYCLKVISKMSRLQFFLQRKKYIYLENMHRLFRKTLNLKLIFLLSLIRTGILRKTRHLNAIFIY